MDTVTFTLPAAAVFREVGRGKVLVGPDGYEYSKRKEEDKRIYYHCAHRKKYDCKKVYISVVKENMMVVSIRGEHTHDTDLVAKEVEKYVKEAVTEAGNNPTVSPRTVLGNLTNRLGEVCQGNSAINAMPTPQALKMRINREREKNLQCPKIPHTWDQMDVPDQMKKTAGGEQFLITEETLPGGEKVLGFASPTGLQILDESDICMADGTFEMAESTLFKQVFIITGKTQTAFTVPCAFFLLPSKDWTGYHITLKVLSEKFNITGPRLFYSDFESAILKAIRLVYPNTELRCCDVHLMRALRKNIRKNHLLAAYNSDPRLQEFVRRLWGLSLVPEDQVVKVWESFVEKSWPEIDVEEEWTNVEPENVEDFLIYFEKTWIGLTNPRSGGRRNPRFPIHLWNKYTAVMDEEPTTTNSAEGFNSASKLYLQRNASIWAVITQFKTEESLVLVKLREAALGNSQAQQNTSRNVKREGRNKQLKSLVANFNQLNVEDYFGYLIDYYNDDLDLVA